MKNGILVKNKKGLMLRNRNRLIFYILVLALPVTQVLVFYFWMNINSVLLAFQKYDVETDKMLFAGLDNFKRVFSGNFGRSGSEILAGIRNSFAAYFIGLFASLCIGLPFSNAIYKKVPFSGTFKVFLFLPQVLSVVVMSLIYMFFSQEALPAFFKDSIIEYGKRAAFIKGISCIIWCNNVF